jgi:hypothetical protein
MDHHNYVLAVWGRAPLVTQVIVVHVTLSEVQVIVATTNDAIVLAGWFCTM